MKKKQIFIVTHNPNLGTLLKGKIIVANISENSFGYTFNNLVNENDTSASLYLEGGLSTLDARLNINKNDIEKLKKERE